MPGPDCAYNGRALPPYSFGNTATSEAIECILCWMAHKSGSVTAQNNHRHFHDLRETPYDQPLDMPSSDDDDLFLTAPWPCNVNTPVQESGE